MVSSEGVKVLFFLPNSTPGPFGNSGYIFSCHNEGRGMMMTSIG